MKRILFLLLIASSAGAFDRDPTLFARLQKNQAIMDPLSLPTFFEEYLDFGSPYPRIRYEVHRERGSYYLQFVPEVGNQFIPYSAYHSIIRIPVNRGEIDQIKVFLLPGNQDTFLRLQRQGQLATVQWVLENQEIHRAVPLNHSLEELVKISWERLVELYPRALPWDLVFPTAMASHTLVEDMSHEIAKALVSIPEVDDGGMDEWGNYVYIDNGQPQEEVLKGLNCSGLVKWVGDGVLAALEERYFSLGDLRKKNMEERVTSVFQGLEERREPYFGLDWIRNIAQGIYRARGREITFEQLEVKGYPYLGFVPDRGYVLEGLGPVLYWAAVKDPGHFYLASISGEFGRDPMLIQHRHVTVFFPYFTKEGAYKLRVFDTHKESSLESLIQRFQGHRAYLVRVPAMRGLKLPGLE